MSFRPAGLSDDDEDEFDDEAFTATFPGAGEDGGEKSDDSNESDSEEEKHWPHRWENRNANRGFDVVKTAIIEGNVSRIKEEMENGMSPNEILEDGWSLLMFACKHTVVDVVRHLLNAEADPNYNKNGFTAFMALCMTLSSEEDDVETCARLLLMKKADVNVKSRQGFTALMLASREGKEHLVKMLLQADAKPNTRNTWGWTALMFAAWKAHGRIIYNLLESGADLTLINKSADTAAAVAKSNGYETLAELLESISDGNVSYKRKLLNKEFCERKGETSGIFEDSSTMMYSSLDMILGGIGLDQHRELFKKHNIDVSAFSLLTEDDLVVMGIDKVGDRKLIIDAIKQMHTSKWEQNSLAGVQYSNCISAPEIAALMANMAFHLNFTQRTSIYLLRLIKKNPQCLEFGKEVIKVSHIKGHVKDTLSNTELLRKAVSQLYRHLSQIEGNTEYQSADLIEGRKVKWKTGVLAVVLLPLIGVLGWRHRHTLFFQVK